MRIAAVMADGRGETDRLMTDTADWLLTQGRRPIGVVQANLGEAERHPCDTVLKVLPDGPLVTITQDLGAGATGCRLDPAALETAVSLVAARLAGPADIFLLNKFGQQEAAGRAFREVIAAALAQDLPVLSGVAGAARGDFDAFAGGMAESLAPAPAAIRSWCRAVLRNGA